MSSEISVTNTLAFLFPKGAAQPTLEEMARFVKTLDADKTEMESAYKISEDRSVYVKFKNESAMKKALMENTVKHSFHYSNGKVVDVYMSVAGRNVRYVRIFDLPPEVDDRDISRVLEKFGQIKRLDREKFPLDLGLGDLSTGVRGVHMDIEKEIPPIVRIVGRKGRVYYEQMTPRCYLCLSEGHFKAACPKKKEKSKISTKLTSDSHTYAGVAGAGGSSSCEIEGKAEKEKEDLQQEEIGAAVPTTENTSTMETDALLEEEEEYEEEDIDETAVAEERQKQAWYKISSVIQEFKKAKEREEQAKAAEEQRKQRKKPSTRTKTGSFSPPLKKKY